MAVWTCSKCGATQEMDDKPEFCGSCGEPFKEKKVDVVYTVELKEYSDDTKVTVSIDGTDVPLEKI